jgi:mono/diheme cytochrome c family protein
MMRASARADSGYAVGRLAILLTAGFVFCLSGRGEFPPTVWDGIYTEGQAARGEAAYRQYCASCHGPRLDGGDFGPSLTGSDFVSDWDLLSVGDIVDEMQISMPPNRPRQLGEETNALILAYILKLNNFPAGKQELPPGADPLRGIVFTARRFGE